jgi:flagellar basal-body rod protein FlgF
LKDLWISVSGALAQQRNVETIANNVANANTPGFKKDQLAFKEYLTALNKGNTDIDLPSKEWKPEDFYKSYGAENAQVEVSGSFTIHDQGSLSPTNNPLDFAISGQGFFELLTESGIRFSRKGNFTINNEGYLVTPNGHFVLSKTPKPEAQDQAEEVVKPEDRKIKVSNQAFSVASDGSIYNGETKAGELSLVAFRDQVALKKEGNSLFINQSNDNQLETAKGAIHQGFVEESNVNAIQEMSNLIKAHRHFESIQNVIKTYDNIAGKTATDIAKF